LDRRFITIAKKRDERIIDIAARELVGSEVGTHVASASTACRNASAI
jgi:hypothetical protein